MLSIGSNLGERLAHLQSVLDVLGTDVLAVSPVYETAPWGPVPQDDYLNAVVVARGRTPRDWLALAQDLEQSAERVRSRRWGPRTLDVDVISCRDAAGEIVGELGQAAGELTLPHPRAHERAFVLVPWLKVEPDASLTVRGVRRPIGELAAELDPAELSGVRPFPGVLTMRVS